jgi:hypothetical protein
MAEASVTKIDEFSFVLLAGLLLIFIMMFVWTTPTEGPPIVDESSFSLAGAPGDTLTLTFQIRSRMTLASINLTATGDAAKWISFSKNDFSITNLTTATATVKIPRNTPYGIFNTRIMVSGIGGSDSFTIAIDVGKASARQTLSRIIPEEELPTGFSVSYEKGTETVSEKDDVQIYTGYLSNRAMTMMSLITEDRLSMTTGSELVLDIADTNGLGNLIILVNDKTIYSRNVGVGEIRIPIDMGLLDTSNTITVRADTPGWLFWTNTIYSIRSVRLDLDYEGIFSQSFNVTLAKDEVAKFKDLSLFYRVIDHSENMPEMKIKVNNQIVYWEKPSPVMLDRTFSSDMFGNALALREGSNVITFLFERNAQYTVTDALLKVEYWA